MKLYSTICKEAEAEQTIEKSRFIAHIKPVSSKEEADAFIAEIRKKYRDATHNVPAMVIGDKMQIQWGSDDGEPGGTSGTPMAQLLANEGLTNVVVVVTRYFGGIKLGPGGLVRAYTSSAKMAIEAAGVCDVQKVILIDYKFDYTFLSKIQNAEKEAPFRMNDLAYGEYVTGKIVVSPEDYENVMKLLNNLTSGKGEILAETEGEEAI